MCIKTKFHKRRYSINIPWSHSQHYQPCLFLVFRKGNERKIITNKKLILGNGFPKRCDTHACFNSKISKNFDNPTCNLYLDQIQPIPVHFCNLWNNQVISKEKCYMHPHFLFWQPSHSVFPNKVDVKREKMDVFNISHLLNITRNSHPHPKTYTFLPIKSSNRKTIASGFCLPTRTREETVQSYHRPNLQDTSCFC